MYVVNIRILNTLCLSLFESSQCWATSYIASIDENKLYHIILVLFTSNINVWKYFVL